MKDTIEKRIKEFLSNIENRNYVGNRGWCIRQEYIGKNMSKWLRSLLSQAKEEEKRRIALELEPTIEELQIMMGDDIHNQSVLILQKFVLSTLASEEKI